jgi:hypothetical protein
MRRNKGTGMKKFVTREEFDLACEALWSEMEYINNLPRRTDDEAKDVPGFLSLARVYMRRAEDTWADQPGTVAADGSVQVEDALHAVRKVAGIMVRAMVYNGIRHR